MRKVASEKRFATLPLIVMATGALLGDRCVAETHVYEVVEEVFYAERDYDNAYLEVDLWVELTGPGGRYRIPAFWDGGNTFRVRLVATSPGQWHWSTSEKTGDRGLDGKHGTFNAVVWTEAEKEANPNRRGFIRVASNNRTLEYADGTSFFYTGDTWWSALTKIYAWGTSDCVSGISFQDAVALRKGQGFNGINMIACFPSDTQKGIWDESTHGMKVAEDGSTPFKLDQGVDYTQINPKYWYALSPRILDLNSVSNQGRDGASIQWLRDMFFLDDPLPVYNIEPYYPGLAAKWHPKSLAGMSDGQMAQFLMYGCVLNGGALVGHAWGDCYWGGAATLPKQPIPDGDPHCHGFNRFTAASMGKLKDFILDSGHDYRVLVPAVKHLAAPDGEFVCLALAPDKSQGLGFVSAGKNICDIVKLTHNAFYSVEWWHIDDGGWQDKTVHQADASGHLSMPGIPGGNKRGWAYRILRTGAEIRR